MSERTESAPASSQSPKYPGVVEVINGNGAVARVMNMVCGGVIGYPITPSTEISETFERALAQGVPNVWGKRPFFFEPEGEHSAQSGALGAALTGGKFISNASSSQGILYGMESHFVTVGRRIGGFVLHVAARVVSRHSLNVMGGHDDVYALLPSGYTVLFGATPEEAADLALISYRTVSLSLIPVANCMDGFSTSHMMSETRMPQPDLVREYLGDPTSYIESPTVAQEMLYGAKGRAFQFQSFTDARVRTHDVTAETAHSIRTFLDSDASAVEQDSSGILFDHKILPLLESEGMTPPQIAAWRRQWVNAPARGTRPLLPALVDVNNPGLTGPVQNQPDFQAGIADHHTHFEADVPNLVRRAMDEYNKLTGSEYAPVRTFMTDDADVIMVALGSISQDVQAVLPYLRAHGIKAGLVQIMLLQPFPEAEFVEAVRGARSITVLERAEQAALTTMVNTAIMHASQNSRHDRYPGVPAIDADSLPEVSTAFFGLGGHDVQPRHLIAAYQAMNDGKIAPEFYIGSTFFTPDVTGENADMQTRLREAYPATETMALDVEPNPAGLLPPDAMRIRFHSVGGYGTIATGKLLTDILADMLQAHSKSTPKYGSEKSGSPTNYYITLSSEPIKITNAELEDVEIVVSPDHMVFAHTDPLKGLTSGGTFILQSNRSPRDTWHSLPESARETIRTRHINFFIVDAFKVAKEHAPNPDLETRMMGVAFIGAVCTKVDRIAQDADESAMLQRIEVQIKKKFGAKGDAVVSANMDVVRAGASEAQRVDYEAFDQESGLSGHSIPKDALAPDPLAKPLDLRDVSVSRAMCSSHQPSLIQGLFDADYFDRILAQPFADGTVSEAPVYPGTGYFLPSGSAAMKDKGLFRRRIPVFDSSLCTGCMECALACPDSAIPNTVFTISTLLRTAARQAGSEGLPIAEHAEGIAEKMRENFAARKDRPQVVDVFYEAALAYAEDEGNAAKDVLIASAHAIKELLITFPTARTRPFFDAMEKKTPGDGALFAATVDPWKCTGCLECVQVCGPKALIATDQDDDVLSTAEDRFSFLAQLPNTPEHYSDPYSGPTLDLKRVFLNHRNYYSTIGGHGACRGCGEVTAIHQTMALTEELNRSRATHHRDQLTSLVDSLREFVSSQTAKLSEGGSELDLTPGTLNLTDPNTPSQSAVLDLARSVLATLERRLYFYEGPAGREGPASAVVANSTGCSSVYASTAPYNSYQQPWVNGLFQDAQPLAKGIFEGLASDLAGDVLAMRQARAILDGVPIESIPRTEPNWKTFTDDELALMPAVLTIGGDGATYDIGFGALSRILTSGTPLKMLVLNTGAYSNTGGQASTASLEGQDSDLARVGAALQGKDEQRKELGLLAAMHPEVLVVSTSTAYQAHFLRNVTAALEQNDYPAVIDVYTPCQPEHGIADDAATEQSKLAVKSRVSPLFVHEPQHENVSDRFILAGNPNVNDTWARNRLAYVNSDGVTQTLELPYTPADFALTEQRFRKHFHVLQDDEPNPTPIAQYIDLDPQERLGATPFVYTTKPSGELVKMHVGEPIVKLTEQCREYWHLLQYLAGHDLDALRKQNAKLEKELQHVVAQYEEIKAQAVEPSSQMETK